MSDNTNRRRRISVFSAVCAVISVGFLEPAVENFMLSVIIARGVGWL